MKRLHWTIAAIAIVAIAAAACSGGSSNLISMGPGQSHQYKVGYIHATLRGMPEAQKHAIDRIVARVLRSHHLNPKFLPGTTSEVDFNLVSVGGYPVVYPYGSEYSFKLFPPQAQGRTDARRR